MHKTKKPQKKKKKTLKYQHFTVYTANNKSIFRNIIYQLLTLQQSNKEAKRNNRELQETSRDFFKWNQKGKKYKQNVLGLE